MELNAKELAEEAQEAVSAVHLAVPHEVVDGERDEDHQHDDLQDETRFGNVDARADGLDVDARGGEGAARGLQHEADDVGGDEDVVEESRVEA